MLIIQCSAIVMALTGAATDSVISQQPVETVPTAQNVPDDRLLTVDHVAEILGFAASYVYELLRRGEILGMHHGKYWRVRRSEVERFIAKHEGTAT